MTRSPRRLVVLAAAVAVGLALVALAASSPVGVTESRYAYSVTVATNATLEDLALVLPLPADADGDAPLAEAVERGDLRRPAGWQAAVVATDRGPGLRLTADAVPAERRGDGRHYSTYEVGASVAAGGALDVRDPLGHEPTLAAPGETRPVPCPNVAIPRGGGCYAYSVPVTVAYSAPDDASVDVFLVATGANEYLVGDRRQYYERVTLFLDGPQDGRLEADGFGSVAG